jgi:O-glycosyl hydrolase
LKNRLKRIKMKFTTPLRVLLISLAGFAAIVILMWMMLPGKPVAPHQNEAEVFVSSLSGERIVKKSPVRLYFGMKESGYEIIVDTAIKYQMIEGFGATFNEAGMICLNSIPSERRDSVLRMLFDSVSGAGYTLMKSPIAACDFASAGPWYSYNDTPGDTMMTNFSISRDLGKDGLIPYIKSASQFGRFRIESPMDFAPDWMLYSLNNGEKNIKKEYYRTLARYYSRYLSEYAKNGVRIDYLNPFNEPQNKWYSNERYKTIGLMVKKFIVPQLRADGVNVKIQLCETADRGEALRKLPDAIDDPEVMKLTNSVTVHGYDYYDFTALSEFHKVYPSLPIWMTEVCYAPTNGNVPDNGPKYAPVYEFADGEFWGNMIMNDIKNYVSAWIYWNMILDENGGPWLVSKVHGDPENNRQHPVVVIDRSTKQVSYTGLYYYLAHFSRFIRPGAYRIGSSGRPEQLNFAAFKNPDNSVILVIINNGADIKSTVQINGRACSLELPAHSIATLRWPGIAQRV